jgi:hypothetical protein
MAIAREGDGAVSESVGGVSDPESGVTKPKRFVVVSEIGVGDASHKYF